MSDVHSSFFSSVALIKNIFIPAQKRKDVKGLESFLKIIFFMIIVCWYRDMDFYLEEEVIITFENAYMVKSRLSHIILRLHTTEFTDTSPWRPHFWACPSLLKDQQSMS
jgi:hypothetical protein